MCATHPPWRRPERSGDISGSTRLGSTSALLVPRPWTLAHTPRAEFLHKAPVSREPLPQRALDFSLSWPGSRCCNSAASPDLTCPRRAPGQDRRAAARCEPPSTAQLLPPPRCPGAALQSLPLQPAAAVGIVDVGVAFLREVVEEDGGIKVLAAHLRELQGPLAGHLGLQRAAGLQEAVDLAEQATRPLQATGWASEEAWRSGAVAVGGDSGLSLPPHLSVQASQAAQFQKPKWGN